MSKPSIQFIAQAPLTFKTHKGNEVRVSDGTVLNVSRNGKLVIPAHKISMGKKGFKEIPAVTTVHFPIDFQKFLVASKV